MSKKNKKTISEKWYDYIWIIGLVAFVPLIVRMKVIDIDDTIAKFWTGQDTSMDFFAYYKVIFIVIFTVLGIITYYFKVESYKTKKVKIYIPIFIYGIFIILSTIFSKYKNVSLFGFVQRYEGAIVLICYLIILYLSINMINKEKHIKIIYKYLLISASIISIIGLFQFLNMDPLKTDLGRKIMLPLKYHYMADKLNFTMAPKQIYSTLYNPNYVGSYMVMILSISLVLLIYSKGKNKIIYGVLSLLFFINLIGSQSRSGYIAFILSIFLIVYFLRHNLKLNKKNTIIMFSSLIIVFAVILFTNNTISMRIKNLTGINDNKTEKKVEDIIINKNEIYLKTSKYPIKITLDNYQLKFKDVNDKLLDIKLDNKNILLTDSRYNDYKFSIINLSNMSVINVNYDEYNMKFAITQQGFKILSPKGEPVELQHPKSIGFKGSETFASSRGYIWSRSIPLLRNTIFIGYGPDTFPIFFPQYDYAGKLLAYKTYAIIVDKPHNLYLQIALGTGIISLIAFLSIIALYLYSSIKLYKDCNVESFYTAAGISIFIAVCSYLIAGLANDSVVSVAPVFWALLGIGISINYNLLGNK